MPLEKCKSKLVNISGKNSSMKGKMPVEIMKVKKENSNRKKQV